MGVDLFDKTVVSTYDAIIKVGDNDTITSSAKRLSDGRGNDTAIWLSTTNMGVNAAPTAGYTLTVNGNILGTKIDATTFQILGGTGTQGTITWNTDENTADLIQNGTTLQVGQQVEVHVKNQTLATIPKGTPVYVTGTLGASGRLTVAPFIADGSIDGKFFLGVTAEDIINGEDGKLLTFGKIRGLDTSAYSEGQTLFISDTVAGEFQTTAPTSPSLVFEIAIVINSHVNNGTIFVRTGGTASAGSTLQEVTDNGNTTTNSIGIGTTPASGVELHVKDSVGNTEIRIEQSDIDTAYGILRFAGDDPSGSKYIIAYNSNDAFQPNEISLKNALGDITFHNGTAGAVERVRIDASTGNVGIGTTAVNAAAKLHVKDDDGAEIRIEDTTSTTFETLRFIGDASTYEKYIVGYNSANVFSANDLHLVNAGGDIVFRTETAGGGTERMRITSSGNIGIGTSSPARQFTIENSGNAVASIKSGNTSSSFLLMGDTDSDNIGMFKYDNSNNSMQFYAGSNSSERMRIDYLGNLIVGGTVAQSVTSGRGNITINGASTSILNFATAETRRGYLYHNGTDLALINTENNNLLFGTGGSTRMTLDINGHLGLGTTTPSLSSKIHIIGSSGDGEIRIQDSSNTSFESLRFVGDASTFDKGLIGYNSANLFDGNALHLYNTAGDIVFRADTGGGTGAERMRIDSNGNIGIGTSNPSEKLSIRLGSNADRELEFKLLTAAPAAQAQSYIGIVDGSGAAPYNFAGNLHIQSRSSAGRSVILQPIGGTVGIGTSSPLAKLDVAGDIYLSQSLAFSTITTTPTLSNYIHRVEDHAIAIGTNSTERIRLNSTEALQVSRVAGYASIKATSAAGGYMIIDSQGQYLSLNHYVNENILLGIGGGDVIINGTVSQSVAANRGNLTINGGTNGSILNFSTSDIRRGYLFHTGTELQIINTQYGAIRFGTDNSSDMTLSAIGNLGIGTTSPNAASKLHVFDNQGAEIRIEDNTSTTFETLRFIGDASTFDKGLTGYNSANPFDANALHLYNTAGDIVFRSSVGGGTGTERVRIAASGNVGISDTTPSYKLDVNGDIRAQDYLYIGTGGGFFYNDAGSRIRTNNEFYTNNSTTYLYSDFLYLGDASGDTILVRGNTISGNNWVINSSGDADFNSIPAGKLTGSIANVFDPASRYSIGLIGGSTALTRDKIRVWGSSLYTIGMTSGYTYGHLANDYAMSFQMNNTSARGFWWGDDAHTNAQGAMSLTTNGRLTVATSISVGEGESVVNPETFQMYVNGTSRVDGTLVLLGRIGVGTSSPSAATEILPIGTEDTLILGRGGGASNIKATTGEYLSLESSGQAVIINHYNTDNIWLCTGGGDVGVGDTSPSYKLDVNGTIRATADVIAYSDIRVKENINTIDNALEKVRNLRGVEYNKIGETEQKIGVIAQEVEKVIPQVVQEDKEGMKSVAYGNIVGVLIEAIKEQQEQIEDLKAQVERLIATR